MEKPTCGIVKDLLISYYDGLTAESVTDMVQEHLADCPGCSQYYEELKKQQKEAEEEELSRSRSFGEKLRSVRYYIIGVVIGLLLPVAVLVIWYLLGTVGSYIETMFYLQQIYN